MESSLKRFLLATCMAAVSQQCLAQEADAQSNVAGAEAARVDAADEPSTGDPIVVTANRREQSVQDVPVSVTAYGQEGLDVRGVKDVDDLGRITPGVNLRSGGNLSSSISVRGIASSVGAGTTGIYIDDTPMQVRAIGAGQTFSNSYPAIFDLERVEVLRGPQGTLFGAGSEGGAVRFITPTPSLQSYSGYGRAELAFTEHGDPSMEAGIALGGPIVEDKVGFRVSGFYRLDGGYVDRVNAVTGARLAKNADDVSTLALRGALRIEPFEDFSLTPSIYYQKKHRSDTSLYWRALSDPEEGIFRNGQPISQPGTDTFTLYSLAGQYDLGPVSFFSNTSYFDRAAPALIDYTGYVGDLLGVDPVVPIGLGTFSPVDFRDAQKVFTQEARLQSAGTNRLNWVVGAFYQKSKQEADEFVRSPDLDVFFNSYFGAPTDAILGSGLTQPGDIAYSGVDRSRDSQIAGFGQVDFEVLPGLTLIAGARYAKNKFDFTNMQGGPFNGGTTSSVGKQSETSFTPKVGISYEPNPDLTFYATASKGYRPGGANTAVSATRCATDLNELGLTKAPDTYGSDSLWSYEAGAKGQMFDRTLTFESSAYYIKWKGIQNSVGLPNCGFQFIANLGEAEVKGFDLRLALRPAAGLTLEGTIAHTDARYTQEVLGTTTAAGTRSVITAAGQPLPTPPWQLNFAFAYERSLNPDWDGYLRADYNYAKGYNLALPGTFSYDATDPSRESTNFAALRVGARRGDLDVSAFVDNIFNSTDRLSVSHSTLASPLIRDVTFRPRTFGVTTTFRY